MTRLEKVGSFSVEYKQMYKGKGGEGKDGLRAREDRHPETSTTIAGFFFKTPRGRALNERGGEGVALRGGMVNGRWRKFPVESAGKKLGLFYGLKIAFERFFLKKAKTYTTNLP